MIGRLADGRHGEADSMRQAQSGILRQRFFEIWKKYIWVTTFFCFASSRLCFRIVSHSMVNRHCRHYSCCCKGNHQPTFPVQTISSFHLLIFRELYSLFLGNLFR